MPPVENGVSLAALDIGSKKAFDVHISEFRLSIDETAPPVLRPRRWFAHAWRTSLCWGALSVTFVLAVNLTLLIYVRKHYPVGSDGLAVLLTGSCKTSKTAILWVELAVNILSTLLLSASNNCAQLVVAPTRDEIRKAHAKGEWLDIGVPSVKNLFAVGRWRVVCWGLLYVSSVPLHLL